jgi:hypothetical protein
MKELIKKFKSKSLLTRIGIVFFAILILNGFVQVIRISNAADDQQEKIAAYIDPRPGDQIAFIETFKKLKQDYTSADGNEVVKSEVASQIKNHLSTVRTINGWIARVSKITTRSITVDFDNPELAEPSPSENYLFEHFGEMYVEYNDMNLIKELRAGDYIMFSGQIEREMSITDRGSVDEPEVEVKATSCQIFNK